MTVRVFRDERDGGACRHGYRHGDCPLRCRLCGHRCELHDRTSSACTAFECGCVAFSDDDDDDDPESDAAALDDPGDRN